MTDTVLNPAQVSLSMPELPKRKPVVDLGTRMAHASMALAFLISYVTSESEYWRLAHVNSGYILSGVMVFRFVWGFLGPASASWRMMFRRLAMWSALFEKLKQGECFTGNFWVGVSSWAMSAAVFLIYLSCAVAIASGWAIYSEILGDGVLGDVFQELHEVLGNAALSIVCMHLFLVITLRVFRGPQALRSMLR